VLSSDIEVYGTSIPFFYLFVEGRVTIYQSTPDMDKHLDGEGLGKVDLDIIYGGLFNFKIVLAAAKAAAIE